MTIRIRKIRLDRGQPPPTSRRIRGHQLIPNTDAFLMAWQAGARVTFPKGIFFQVAPTIYNYTGNGDTFNVHYQGGYPSDQRGVVGAKPNWHQQSARFRHADGARLEAWEFADAPLWRFCGEPRRRTTGPRLPAHPGFGDQRYAFQAGAGVGQLKKKHDWQLDVYYQLSEQYALDPNLVDDDIFDGRQNMEGVVVKAGYALSDAVSVNFTYHYGWRHDDNLGTGGTPITIGINPLDQYQLFFADLNIKF